VYRGPSLLKVSLGCTWRGFRRDAGLRGSLGLGQIQPAIEGCGAWSIESQHERDDEEGKGVFRACVAVVAVHHCDSEQHVDSDHKRDEMGEQAEDEQDAAYELGKGGDIAEPVREAERSDEVSVVLERAVRDDLRVAMKDHRGAENETQEERTKGLQAVQPLDHVSSVDAKVEEWRRL
jgi:hypothetical protein